MAFQCHTCQGPELGILCSNDKHKSGKLDEMPHMHTTDLFPIQADNLCFFWQRSQPSLVPSMAT